MKRCLPQQQVQLLLVQLRQLHREFEIEFTRRTSERGTGLESDLDRIQHNVSLFAFPRADTAVGVVQGIQMQERPNEILHAELEEQHTLVD
jgi:hypothetical protein